MTPIHLINYGEPQTDEDRCREFYEHAKRPIFGAFLQYLRDEAFANLALSIQITQGVPDPHTGKVPAGDPATLLGAFDGLSQVIVKLKAASETPPKVEE